MSQAVGGPGQLVRYCSLLLAFSVLGCSRSSDSGSTAEALANLRTQAGEVGQAMIRKDHQRTVDLTHPALVKLLGGREKFFQGLEAMDKEFREQGLKFHGFRFEEPSRLVESAGSLYAIYPYALDLTGAAGEPASQPSYLVCVSSDRGKTWKFLDGAGVGADRTKLKQVLPDFPDELSLPEPRPLVVHPK